MPSPRRLVVSSPPIFTLYALLHALGKDGAHRRQRSQGIQREQIVEQQCGFGDLAWRGAIGGSLTVGLLSLG